MKYIDDVRGIERTILLGDQPGHTTQGATPISNCVVEVASIRSFPYLSLRFYNKSYYGLKIATECAEHGRPLFNGDTPIGTEINLGPDLAQSVVEQIQAQWPQFQKAVASLVEDEGTAGEP